MLFVLISKSSRVRTRLKFIGGTAAVGNEDEEFEEETFLIKMTYCFVSAGNMRLMEFA